MKRPRKLNQVPTYKQIPRYVVLILYSMLVLLLILYTVTNSFMSAAEVSKYYANINAEAGHTIFHIIPDKFSLDSYYQVFFASPNYLRKFWISMGLTCIIVAGQVVISCLAGYGFAKFRFPGRDVIFFLLIIMMMMPYQVTLVSNYIVLDKLKLIGTYWSLILPGIFSPFGVFLMRQVISTMPDSLIEAAKLDGANQIQLLTRVVLPRCKSGVISLIILSFIDNWNMVEQPLIFLDDTSQYPLSVFLAQVNSSNLNLSFTCGILAMLPVAILFLFFEKELVEGIGFSNLK
jgi:multiple sugar transport system permease protein